MTGKNRTDTIPILISISYKYSMNRFEEIYANALTYTEVEQESYFELKELFFKIISPAIKFRKFSKDKNVLVVKADLTKQEYDKLRKILRGKEVDWNSTKDKINNPRGKKIYARFNFLHDFIITKIKTMEKEDLIEANKILTEDDEKNYSLFLKKTGINNEILKEEDEMYDTDFLENSIF